MSNVEGERRSGRKLPRMIFTNLPLSLGNNVIEKELS